MKIFDGEVENKTVFEKIATIALAMIAYVTLALMALIITLISLFGIFSLFEKDIAELIFVTLLVVSTLFLLLAFKFYWVIIPQLFVLVISLMGLAFTDSYIHLLGYLQGNQSIILIILLVLFAIFIYFLPTIIAYNRGHQSRLAIFLRIFYSAGVFFVGF